MDIEKLIAYIESKIYENHKQELTAEMVKDAVVMTAKEIGVAHEDVMAVIRENSDDLSETLKLYLTRTDAKELLDKKLDAELYETDKEVSNKEKQELDVKLTQTKQELDSVKNSLSHMGNGVVGEAKGGSVTNLPNNAMRSVVPNYRFEGLTVQNLIKNGDFKEGLKGWDILGDKNSSLNDGVLTLIGSTTANKNTYTSHPKGERLFVSFEFYLEKDSDSISVNYNQGPIPKYTGKKGWNKYVGYIQNEGNLFNTQFLRSSKDVESFKITNYMAFNLTQMFGAGNEPSKEWCDEHLPDYVEGTKSVQLPMRVKSVGENLLNLSSHLKNNQKGSQLGSVVIPATLDTIIKIQPPMKAKYALLTQMTKESNSRIRVIYEDDDFTDLCRFKTMVGFEEEIYELKDKNIVRLEYKYSSSVKELSEVKCNSFYLGDFKFFKPYQESLAYFNDEVELRSIGTVKDFIENGKLYKNIGFVEDLSKVEVSSFETNINSNVNVLVLNFNKIGGVIANSKIISNIIEHTSSNPAQATSEDIGKINTSAYYYNDLVNYYVAKNTNLSQAKEELKEVSLSYIFNKIQIPLNLNTSGLIEANPNGTVFFEPITNLTGFYDNGLEVEGLDILEVEEFSHLVNGVYQNLDVSKVKVEGGKLTHPDAKNGIVYLVYRYDDNAVWGENTISYYNSDKTLKSPNGKIWKKVESATDTGELVVTLEEVTEEIVEP